MIEAWKRKFIGSAVVLKALLQLHVQRWLAGLAWLFVGSVIGMMGAIALLFSLFFELAKMPELALPSLITGLVALLLAVLVALEGKRLWR